MKIFQAFFIGAIFGIGIILSGMADPAKVLNFFDIAGSFDPSLIFVMGGALIVTAIGYRVIFATRTHSLMGEAFQLPTAKHIDKRLVVGSAIFGIGWGIAGFCPGAAFPALGASLVLGHLEALWFVIALILGMAIARLLQSHIALPANPNGKEPLETT